MAARRASSRSRSGGRRSSRAAQTNNNTPVIIGIGVAVVAILIVIAVNMGGGDPDPDPKPQAPRQEEPSTPPDPAPARKSDSNDAHLTDPDTPAPAMPGSLLSEADAYYKEAKKLHDNARRAQAAGNDDEFNTLINDSWDKMLELDKFISKYTDWLENADMEDWRVPSSYRPLQSRMNRWDKLKGGIKRIKPNRR